MVLPDWVHLSATAFRKGRIPTLRRRARWRAEREFEKAVAELKPGDIAIDCGANVGVFTRRMASTGATVYAFEPDPCAFDILMRHFFTMPHVKLTNAAVGVHDHRVHLYRSESFDLDPINKTTSSTLFSSKRNVDLEAPLTVEQVDLCSFIDHLESHIAILKMDIEGAEVEILERLLDSGLIHRIGNVFVETHERQIPDIAERTSTIKDRVKKLNLEHVNLDWQ